MNISNEIRLFLKRIAFVGCNVIVLGSNEKNRNEIMDFIETECNEKHTTNTDGAKQFANPDITFIKEMPNELFFSIMNFWLSGVDCLFSTKLQTVEDVLHVFSNALYQNDHLYSFEETYRHLYWMIDFIVICGEENGKTYIKEIVSISDNEKQTVSFISLLNKQKKIKNIEKIKKHVKERVRER